MLLSTFFLRLVVCFPSLYKQDDTNTRIFLPPAIFVQHLANYALDLS